jgi:ArsR family transcriptional regulator, arsenate/arsenite/antimonite-responsive transcriptional repressor
MADSETYRGLLRRDPEVIRAAKTLNHAAHPLRLQVLTALVRGPQDRVCLAGALDGATPQDVSAQLGILRSGGLLSQQRRGRQHFFALTPDGLEVTRVIRSTVQRIASRRRPSEVLRQSGRTGDIERLDPHSPEGLACLMKRFADPLRLRILNLLAGEDDVCACQLPAALATPWRSLEPALGYPKDAGLVTEWDDGSWVRYRLSRLAADFHRSLIAGLGGRFSGAEIFRADRVRFAGTMPCTIPIELSIPLHPKEIGTQTA